MWRTLAKPTSYVLAAAYLAIAGFGHAWHDHSHCDDDRLCDAGSCCSESLAACDCDLHRLAAERDGGSHQEEGVSKARTGGNHHACLACLALGHLSVGFAKIEVLRDVEADAEPSQFSLPAAVLAAWPVVYGPRGPPCLGC